MDALAEQGEQLAAGLKDLAAEQEGGFQSRLLDNIADSIFQAAEGLRGQGLRSALKQTDAFARQNPGAFVATAALVGFAAVRFARSALPEDPGTGQAGDPAAGQDRP